MEGTFWVCDVDAAVSRPKWVRVYDQNGESAISMRFVTQSHVFESDRPTHYSGVGKSESAPFDPRGSIWFTEFLTAKIGQLAIHP